MDTAAYLARLNYTGDVTPTPVTLQRLHVAHLQAVPFENLDIHLGVPIVLDVERLFHKIVNQRRGGFCYELNGLFAHLLRALGFGVELLSARVGGSDRELCQEFDHLTLKVSCPIGSGDQAWLADVGFGDAFLAPLILGRADEQIDGLRAYRLEQLGDSVWLWERDFAGQWSRQYRFTIEPRAFTDFAAMCVYHQTSPTSLFTQKRVVTRATPTGRVTLRDQRLIMTRQGVPTDWPVTGDDDYRARLRQHFGIDLGQQPWISALPFSFWPA